MTPKVLELFPPKIEYGSFIKELTEASYEIGKLNGLYRNLINPKLLIAPLTSKEATSSSTIEGTRSTAKDILILEATGESKYDDTIEVQNYKRAIIWSIESLNDRDLNLAFIKDLHSILLEGARGHEKRGRFRNEPVFIGKENDTIENARYVPPEHIIVSGLMENLVNYINTDQQMDLVKIACIHYQFEAIHPFHDGNGRIGRLLIPLYLYKKNLIDLPIFFISGYFEKFKIQYMDELHKVDETNKFEDWISFFLKSVVAQSKETSNLINQLNTLHNTMDNSLDALNSKYSSKIASFIFKKPIFTNKDLNEELGVDRSTSLRLIRKMKSMDILIEASIQGKYYYYNSELMRLI